MSLVLLGLNHRTAPVEVREKFHVPDAELGRADRLLSRHPGIEEGLILSTCNRVEFFAHTKEAPGTGYPIQEFVADYYRRPFDSIQNYFYRFEQSESIHHVFRVASSLDSMVLGEPQILGQVKQAFTAAQEAGAVNGLLQEVMSHALATARKVRRETSIGTSAVSISSAAVELAKKIFGDLQDRTILVIGAGKMSELAAQHLLGSGAGSILVSNRTYQRAVELARAFGGTAIRFDELHDALPRADIIISSTGSPHTIIDKTQVERMLAARRNRPVFLVDIAVPRDIDSRVDELENAFLYDIDDLEQVVGANRKQREREAQWAEQIIQQEVERTMRRIASREVAPTICALGDHLNRIRRRETEHMRGRLGDLTAEQWHGVEALTQGIVNKILHGPITELKDAAGKGERSALINAVRKVFGISD